MTKRKNGETNGHAPKRCKAESTGENGHSKETVRIPVDRYCTAKFDTTHVYQEGSDIYDVLLNQTNVQHNNNKYYIIQLIEENTSEPNFFVWFRWGRVGKAGQNKLEPFGTDLSAAKACFMQKFLDKTHNDWTEREHFEKVNGKYDLVKIDYSHLSQKPEQNGTTSEVVESKLPSEIQLLLKLICDIKSMEEAVAGLQYDAKRAPLGKLTKEQIKAGYVALNKISACISALTSSSSSEDGRSSSKRNGKRPRGSAGGNKRQLEQTLLMACNDFYTRIPHDFGMRVPPLIRTSEEVKQKLELLEALDDIQFAVSMMNEKARPAEHVLDSQYRKLDCDISRLSDSDPVYKILVDYLMTNRGPTHSWYTLELLEVFACTKPSESTQFLDCGNRMLLWHGSRLTNWAGILGRGLLVAPPEAPVTGYMFGKGIYFADCSTKSANYAYPTANKNIGLLALCEVSLGESQVYYQACYTADQLPVHHHSVKGVGKMAPSEHTWQTLPDGVKVPVGSLSPCDDAVAASAALQFNEYVVYNPKQVRLRYLVKVKFNFV